MFEALAFDPEKSLHLQLEKDLEKLPIMNSKLFSVVPIYLLCTGLFMHCLICSVCFGNNHFWCVGDSLSDWDKENNRSALRNCLWVPENR